MFLKNVTGPLVDRFCEMCEGDFAWKETVVRGGVLVLAPISMIACALDTIVGLGATLPTILTLGRRSQIATFTVDQLYGTAGIISNPYCFILNGICWSDALVIEQADERKGLMSNLFIDKLNCIADDCKKSKSLLKRHVASRLTYGLLAIACLVSRVFDACIAIVAVPLSLVMLGKIIRLNTIAFRTLQAPAIVADLFYCAMKIVNPWMGEG